MLPPPPFGLHTARHIRNHLRMEIGKQKRPAHPQHHTPAEQSQSGAMIGAIKRRWTCRTRRAIPPRALVHGARMTQTRATYGNGTRVLKRTRACKRGKCSMDAMDRGSVHALRAQNDVKIELAHLHVVVPSARGGRPEYPRVRLSHEQLQTQPSYLPRKRHYPFTADKHNMTQVGEKKLRINLR